MQFNYNGYKFKIKAYYNASKRPRFALRVNNGDWKTFTSSALLKEYLERAKIILDKKTTRKGFYVETV